ncbi:unspecified product [Leishmania tarentolae]|uniref:Unspecified product n=1 Tax=Leishmania tarentolae TaxID=5689 RepID=A0A640KBG0_LEITA|nr:unspecified product [Leishmania tarentolae]
MSCRSGTFRRGGLGKATWRRRCTKTKRQRRIPHELARFEHHLVAGRAKGKRERVLYCKRCVRQSGRRAGAWSGNTHSVYRDAVGGGSRLC